MFIEAKNALLKILEKKNTRYFEEMFRHNNRSLIVLALILWVEQLVYAVFLNDPSTHIGKTHLFTSAISLVFLIVFTALYYKSRRDLKPSCTLNALHVSYLALLLSISIYRAVYVTPGQISIPVIYIAMLYGTAFLFYLPPKWSLLMYGTTVSGFIVLGRYEMAVQMNHTFVQDLIANNIIAWCASMMAYYRFVQQVDSMILIEEKNVKLRHLSEVDALTSLYNRRKIDACLEKVHGAAIEEGIVYSVLLIDMDYFKSVNDVYGHPTGDKVLIYMSEILKESIGPDDVPGRWGGEEFLILCKATSLMEARILAEKIRSEVENYDFGIPQHITCSVGVSAYHAGRNLYEVVKNADDALYISKSKGRNRVTFIA